MYQRTSEEGEGGGEEDSESDMDDHLLQIGTSYCHLLPGVYNIIYII